MSFFKSSTKEKSIGDVSLGDVKFTVKPQKEKLSESVGLVVTKTEFEFIEMQATKECNSKNGIVRKMLRFYKESVEKVKT